MSIIRNGYRTILGAYRAIKAPKFNPPERVNDSVFIIANGPSFKEQIETYPDMCVNHDVMCMAHIANSEFYEKLKPRYYVIADMAMFASDEKSSSKLVKQRNATFDSIIKKTQWEMQLLVPSEVKGNKAFYDKLKTNPNIKMTCFPMNSFEGFDKPKKYFLKKGRALIGAQTVLIPAIFCAILMGYENIYLFGAEHSWMKDIFCDDNNRVYMHSRHSYGTEKIALFQDKYFKVPSTMHVELSCMAETFRQHEELQKFAKYVGANIYNVTPGSYIDAYERKKMDEILCKRKSE